MEQQLRLEHNGSMDHQVIIHIHIEKHQVIPNALITLLVICDHDGFPNQRIPTYHVIILNQNTVTKINMAASYI